MNRIVTVVFLLISIIAGMAYGSGAASYPALLLPKLSDYNIFAGDPAALTPGNGFQLYELATGLYTDHAEKQRLIKLPAGKTLMAVNDGLPQFPDGTMLVKTFYYFHDKREPSKGKRLIETRLLIKNNSQWAVGTYVWNSSQTDALLATSGSNVAVSWIDEKASVRQISYRIPGARDCASCHNANNAIQPVGIKVRNMNITVIRANKPVNQLLYLQKAGIMNGVNLDQYGSLPAWQDETYIIRDRVRAYLDVNCAHCHSDGGSCARSAVRFGWEIPLTDTHITTMSKRIVSLMANGRMPRTGTTVVDTAALALITKYFQLP